MPTDHNLREQYADWRALETAYEQFMAEVNTRPHRATRQPPLTLLAEEHEHLHGLPQRPHTLCFGQTRKVDRQSTVSVGDAIYSVPHQLIGERVWVRADGEQLIVVPARASEEHSLQASTRSCRAARRGAGAD